MLKTLKQEMGQMWHFFTLPVVSRGGDESPKNRRVTIVGRCE